MRNKIKRSFKRKGFEMVEKEDLHVFDFCSMVRSNLFLINVEVGK